MIERTTLVLTRISPRFAKSREPLGLGNPVAETTERHPASGANQKTGLLSTQVSRNAVIGLYSEKDKADVTFIRCSHTICVRAGNFGKRRIHRWKCILCKSRFSEPHAKLTRATMTLRPETAARAIQCLLEGCSIRCTERLTGLNRNTIMRLLEIIGERYGRFLRKTAKSQVPLCTVRRNLRVGIFRDENPLIAHLCAILFANAPLLLATKDPPFVVLPVVPEQLDELSKVHIQPKDFSSSALGTRRGT